MTIKQPNSGAVWEERTASAAVAFALVPVIDGGVANGYIVGGVGDTPTALLLEDGDGGYTLSPGLLNPSGLAELQLLEMGVGLNRITTFT